MDVLSPSAHADTFTRDHLPPQDVWPELDFDLPELRYPDRLNCAAELLDGGVARFGGGRTCLHDGRGGSWSYGELLGHADRIARVLVEDLGVVPGNRVLLRGPNAPWLVACWFAVLKAGAVAVTTMPLLRAGELTEVLETARVRVALCDERFADELRRADPALRVLTYDPAGASELRTLAAGKPGGFPAVATAADDVALIAFTSGTSGRPKATLHFHRDVLAIADTFSAHVLRPRSDDLFAGSPPLAFTFGLGGLVVFPMRAGAAALLLETPGTENLFGSVDEYGVTVLFTAPTGYRAALRRIRAYDLRSLRRCVSAGESLPLGVREEFESATGLRIIDGIGSTEMLHVFISAADDDIRPGAIGRVVPGFRARVVDRRGHEVPDGVVGQLAVRGPTGCRYLADDRQREHVRDGWTLTGDSVERDADGYFWYRARSDDMIVSAGYNIAAPEVEHALLSHPEVAGCGVVGVPDERRGQAVKAYVQLTTGAAADDRTVKALQAHARDLLAPYKCPRVVEFVSALPHSGTGKLQRSVLRSSAVPAQGLAA